MKKLKLTIIFIFSLLIVFSFCACGSNSTQTASSGTQAASAGQSAATGTQASDPQQTSTEVSGPEIDSNASVDALLGDWVQIDSADRYATITKTDTGYQYEDNDGKYSAVFENGMLTVTVSEGDTADVYVDTKTGHMFLVYQGNATEFKKK